MTIGSSREGLNAWRMFQGIEGLNVKFEEGFSAFQRARAMGE